MKISDITGEIGSRMLQNVKFCHDNPCGSVITRRRIGGIVRIDSPKHGVRRTNPGKRVVGYRECGNRY